MNAKSLCALEQQQILAMSQVEKSSVKEEAMVATGVAWLAGAILREPFCSQELLLCFWGRILSRGSISKKATPTATIKHPQNISLTSQLTSIGVSYR